MSDKIVAISAIVISISALVVSIYEAGLMRKSQRAATWPYVEILTTNLDNYFALKIFNTGVGPAKIQDFKIVIDDVEIDERAFRDSLRSYIGNHVDITWSAIAGRVLPPEKAITFFEFTDSIALNKMMNVSSKVTLSLCYCSVFDQCWVSKGLEQVPVKKCE